MIPPQPQPRRYSRTMPPLSVLISAVLLFQISVLSVYGQFTTQIWDGIFPPPNTITSSDTNNSSKYYNKNESLFPSPETYTQSSSPEDTTTIKSISEKYDLEKIPQNLSTPCECLKFWLCNNDTINTDGTGLLDIRQNFNSPCSSYQEKCCHPPENSIQVTNVQVYKEDVREKCGKWNKYGVGYRITGSKESEAEFGEFPWMVVILNIDPFIRDNTEYLCGGSLIHPKVVLTVAHYLRKRNISEENLMVRAGEWDLKIDSERIPHQDRRVSKVVIHERFEDFNVHNDVALVFLTVPFTLRSNVGTICLPPQGFPFYEQRCQVSGWGGTSVYDTPDLYQVILKKVDVPIVLHKTCEEKLRDTRLGIHFQLHDSFICAGGEIGKDACKGDGGSPLMCLVPGRPLQFYQAGIVSWGIGCQNQNPGVYVSVAMFRDWIDLQMTSSDLDKTYYDANYL